MIYVYLSIIVLVQIGSCVCFNTSSWGEENRQELEQLLHQCEDEKTLIKNVAFRGDKLTEYRTSLRELNLETRSNYAEMITGVGNNLYPLIIVYDVHADQKLSGIGSEYTLYLRNGSIKSIEPAPVEYETNKDLAHVPMGIFSIISQYFLTDSTNWKPKLLHYQESLKYSLRSLQQNELTNYTRLCTENLEQNSQERMLQMAISFVDQCFAQNAATLENFKTFAQEYLPFTKKALKCAVEAQSKAAMPLLKVWKQELGSEWDDLHVVIPVIWPVARINPRQLLFEKLMNPEKIKTHIIKAENINSYQDIRSLLGRIVADRTMSHFVFGHGSNKSIDMHMALSTRRDLTATEALALNLTQDVKFDDVVSNVVRFKDVLPGQ